MPSKWYAHIYWAVF